MAESIACDTSTVKNAVQPSRYRSVVQTITDRLNEAFTDSGLDQVEFARRSGVSKQTVNGWLKGRVTNIRPENLFSASDALGINPRWLATGRGPKSANHSKTQLRLLDTLNVLESEEAQALSESFLSIAEARQKYGS